MNRAIRKPTEGKPKLEEGEEAGSAPQNTMNTQASNPKRLFQSNSERERFMSNLESLKNQTIDNMGPKIQMVSGGGPFSTKGKAKAINFIHMHSGLDERHTKTFYKINQEIKPFMEMDLGYNLPSLKMSYQLPGKRTLDAGSDSQDMAYMSQRISGINNFLRDNFKGNSQIKE